MTSVFNRRAAFGFLGAGSLTFLTACSGLNINSSASDISDDDQTKEPEKDYRGEVKLESYDTSAGTYRAATRTQPPKNVPKPVKPDNIREESAAGLYSSLAFIAASLQYLFATGTTSILSSQTSMTKTNGTLLRVVLPGICSRRLRRGMDGLAIPLLRFFWKNPSLLNVMTPTIGLLRTLLILGNI